MSLLNFTELIRNIFNSENDNNQKIARGQVLDELMVIPTAHVMTYFANKLKDIKKYSEISEFDNINEEQMDILASKFFINRVTGGKSYGFVRVYFDFKQDFETTNSTRFVVTDKKLSYKPVSPSKYGSELLRNAENSLNSNYYIDIAVVSVASDDSYVATEGDSFGINNSNAPYKYAEAIEDFIPGQSRETNEQLYNRLRRSLSDRNLMNIKGLTSMLKEFFPSILSTYTVKAGDPEMSRDIVTINMEEAQGTPKDFKGKTKSDLSVPHTAYVDFFPPNINADRYDTYSPISQPSSKDKPLSVTNIKASSIDPAYHGVDILSEYDD